MKIRIGDSLYYADLNVPDVYYIGMNSDEIKKQFHDIIKDRSIRCSGCGKELKGYEWVSVVHRPMSAIVNGDLKDIWSIYFFCYDNKSKCITEWTKKRPK